MKTRLLLIPVIALCLSTAQAELQFPNFEQLDKDIQEKWGYSVHRTEGNNPSIRIEIPPSKASFVKAARLYIKRNDGRLLSEINLAPWTNKDGSLSINFNLFEDLMGYAEVIIYTDMPDSSIPLTKGGFGGLTFQLRKGFKSKNAAEQ